MNLISILDIDVPKALMLAADVRAKPHSYAHALQGKTLAAIFEKASTRTKLSFNVGICQLGGIFADLGNSHILSGHEDVHDTVNSIAQYADFILMRVNAHSSLTAWAQHSPIPIINGLSEEEHPCQALADLLTIMEVKAGGKLDKMKGLNVAFVGDGNNVCASLLLGCAILGVNIAVASPKGYGLNASVLEKAAKLAKKSGAKITLTTKPEDAATGADVIYTDVWVSMGHEKEKQERMHAFTGYCVTPALMAHAKPDAIFMHCLPAQKGLEVSKEVLEGPQSVVFQQAQNRLHAQKAAMIILANKQVEKVSLMGGVEK
jgi:ornithine carbamoyltransferase